METRRSIPIKENTPRGNFGLDFGMLSRWQPVAGAGGFHQAGTARPERVGGFPGIFLGVSWDFLGIVWGLLGPGGLWNNRIGGAEFGPIEMNKHQAPT